MKDESDLIARTREFSLRIIRLYSSLPKSTEAQVLGKQALRSATSVGAQYREARRGKSVADFVSKVEGALQELDETAYWLELLEGAGIVAAARLKGLRQEVDELTAIMVTIAKTAKQGKKAKNANQ